VGELVVARFDQLTRMNEIRCDGRDSSQPRQVDDSAGQSQAGAGRGKDTDGKYHSRNAAAATIPAR
jgi:hypothetical protein